jgi:DNA-binding response OmpR family regulator
MARILSISYSSALLRTRQLVLESKGYTVTSALGFTEAIEYCRTADYDLVIMGHSIPHRDKEQIIKELRNVCSTPVLALRKPNEEPFKIADYDLDAFNPDGFVEFVKEILAPKS